MRSGDAERLHKLPGGREIVPKQRLACEADDTAEGREPDWRGRSERTAGDVLAVLRNLPEVGELVPRPDRRPEVGDGDGAGPRLERPGHVAVGVDEGRLGDVVEQAREVVDGLIPDADEVVRGAFEREPGESAGAGRLRVDGVAAREFAHELEDGLVEPAGRSRSARIARGPQAMEQRGLPGWPERGEPLGVADTERGPRTDLVDGGGDGAARTRDRGGAGAHRRRAGGRELSVARGDGRSQPPAGPTEPAHILSRPVALTTGASFGRWHQFETPGAFAEARIGTPGCDTRSDHGSSDHEMTSAAVGPARGRDNRCRGFKTQRWTAMLLGVSEGTVRSDAQVVISTHLLNRSWSPKPATREYGIGRVLPSEKRPS